VSLSDQIVVYLELDGRSGITSPSHLTAPRVALAAQVRRRGVPWRRHRLFRHTLVLSSCDSSVAAAPVREQSGGGRSENVLGFWWRRQVPWGFCPSEVHARLLDRDLRPGVLGPSYGPGGNALSWPRPRLRPGRRREAAWVVFRCWAAEIQSTCAVWAEGVFTTGLR
jgi:hypothetical protein